jgi:4-carboxymuconolactone decarboxylase|tara:strand:+ start:662 stop:1264 length:603 start_codon:yes stop_codon:yes gene_type:complete
MTYTPPPDILPESGCRLPLPERDALDDAGKQTYDRFANFQDGALFGLRGPSGLNLHSPEVSKYFGPLNVYLRFNSGLSAELRELVILVAAREMDSRFEWAAHESEALKEGVPQATIDVIKYRKPATGLPDEHLLIIEYGRQVLRDHKVSPEIFAQLNSVFGPKGIVDLAYLLGNYVSLAVFLATIDAQVPDNDRSELPVP